MRKKKLFFALAMLIALLPVSFCKGASNYSLYLASKWKVNDFDGVAYAVFIPSTGATLDGSEMRSDKPRIKVKFSTDHFDKLKVDSYYFREELLPLGIDIPQDIITESAKENSTSTPDAQLKVQARLKEIVEQANAGKNIETAQSGEPGLRVRDKFIFEKKFYIYFEERMNPKQMMATSGANSNIISYRLVITDPDIYGSFEQGKTYLRNAPPLALIEDKLEMPQPTVEKPDQ
jgi:hypothetical protein